MKEPRPDEQIDNEKASPETYLGEQIRNVEINITNYLKYVKDMINRLEI